MRQPYWSRAEKIERGEGRIPCFYPQAVGKVFPWGHTSIHQQQGPRYREHGMTTAQSQKQRQKPSTNERRSQRIG